MSISNEQIEAMLTAPGQPFEMEEVDLGTHTVRNWKNAPRTMVDALRMSASFGDADFIVFQDERWSFKDHYARVCALSHSLVEDFGVVKGDRVAIAMRNYPEWCCAFWAAVSAGAVVVPLNAWLTSDELAYGLNDSGSKVAFVDQERLQRLQRVRGDLSDLEHVIAVRSEQVSDDVVEFAGLILDADADRPLPAVDILPEDTATIFYTSGTTGFPKGTIGTHRNFCSQALTAPSLAVRALLRSGGTLEDVQKMREIKQAGLLTIPLFHVSGCIGMMLGMLVSGGKMVMMYKWDPEQALDIIEQEKITMFGGVPTMVMQLFDVPGLEQRDLSSVMNVAFGGAPAAPEVLRQIRAGVPHAGASNGWGITETSAPISMNGGLDYMEKPESVGRPATICDVKIVDESGAEAPQGSLGELWVRGPNVVKGYWNKAKASAEAFTDGWFHTGDVGKIDEEGFIYIVDRLKDMIIRGGENVYCAEVEAALLEHPDVNEACVFGTPHKVLGEEVAAVVSITAEGAVEEQALQEHVSQRLAKFKVPARIWSRAEPLPVGATGKAQKKELKAYYVAELQGE